MAIRRTNGQAVSFRLEIYKGKKIPSKKKGAKVFTVTPITSQATINEAHKYYKDLAKKHDTTINGALMVKATFSNAESYQQAVIMFCNMIVEEKINPVRYYDGINPEVAVQLEKLRLAGHDLRDHFRGPDVSPIDVLADAPGILQNAEGSGRVQ